MSQTQNYIELGAIVALALPHLVGVLRSIKWPNTKAKLVADMADVKEALLYIGTVANDTCSALPSHAASITAQVQTVANTVNGIAAVVAPAALTPPAVQA